MKTKTPKPRPKPGPTSFKTLSDRALAPCIHWAHGKGQPGPRPGYGRIQRIADKMREMTGENVTRYVGKWLYEDPEKRIAMQLGTGLALIAAVRALQRIEEDAAQLSNGAFDPLFLPINLNQQPDHE